MTVINTNVNALQATNASNTAAAMTSQAMTRLSTGKRINSASDDAAGLAIATSMTSQINSLNQGVKNANDGISLAQTAQGSLDEVTNMLQRVRTLAVQSQNSTYSSDDRSNMNSEVSALKDQISSIVSNTKFNGKAVFSGTTTDTSFSIQAGSDAVTLTSKGLGWTSSGGKSSLDVSSATSATTTVTAVDDLLKKVAATNSTLGAGQNQLQSAVNNMTNTSTNLSAARSRIQDADYSAESTAMAKAQILSQASTAMIAQANQSQQNVLSLLK
jgi:flagellin